MKKKIKRDDLVGGVDLRKPWWGLYPIAKRLNALAQLRDKEQEAWRKAEVIILLMKDLQPEVDPALVTKNRPELAIKSFNLLAKKHPLPLMVRRIQRPQGGFNIYPAPRRETPMQYAIFLLAYYFFSERGWERLKKCPQCGIWFVDSSKNRRKERCSEECTNKWWSWGRRKEAHHKL